MDLATTGKVGRILSPWPPQTTGTRSTPVSGHAVTRKRARTRGFYHHPYRHSHGQPIVAGWNYSWLVQLPARARAGPLRCGSDGSSLGRTSIWSRLSRSAPGWTRLPPRSGGGRPIFTFDAGYDPIQLSLALADQPVGLLVRLRAGRCFYADPTSQPQTGTTTAAWREVRLRRSRDLADAD